MAGEASNKETETAAAAAAALAAQVAQNAQHDRPAPSTSLSHSIDKLDGTMATGHSNYNAWRFRLTRILKEKGLLTIVMDGPGSTPNNEKSPEQESANLSKDNQAFTIITLNVRDSQIPHIQKCATAKQAWDMLRDVHQGIGANGRMILTQRLWSLRLHEGDDMAAHLNAFREMANQIENLSSDEGTSRIHGVDLVSMLSVSLPDSYEPLIMALQSRSETLTFDFIAGRLLQESTRRQAATATHGNLGQGNGTSQSAFIAGGYGRTRGRGGGFRGGSYQRGTRGRGRASFGTTDISRLGNAASANRGQTKKVLGRCHYCDREGHWKAECLKRKTDEAGSRFRRNEESQTAFVAATKRRASDDWVIDSGASQHLSAQKDCFLDYQPISPLKIQIGDGSEIEAVGKGNITLETETASILLRDVLYVPDIGTNLLSVAKAVDHGHNLTFSPTGCQIRGTRTQERIDGVREGNIYLLRAKRFALATLSNQDVAVSPEVWHRRLGHRDFGAAAQGVIGKAVVGLDVKEIGGNRMTIGEVVDRVCETCVGGRQHKEKMTGSREKAHDLLECVHSDVCGPMQTATITGERYFVTFVDEASGRIAVALLKEKHQVLENFKIYRRRAEKDTGKSIRRLRTDGGGEYLNTKFGAYLEQEGIVKVTTPPYTPAQNGLAERANRTLMEGARCMLIDSGLGNEFWGFAVLATAHIINRMPSRSRAGKSPFEIWTGTKPTISHLRVFGCTGYAHVPAETRRKLDRKSVSCIFIGYAEDQGTRVYKLYDKETKKILTSRDVVFDETAKTTIGGGRGVVEEMVGEEEDTREVASMNTGLSQQRSRAGSRDMLRQHPNYRNSEGSNEDANEGLSPTPLPAPTDRESTSASEDIEESITLQAPAPTNPTRAPPEKQRRLQVNTEDRDGGAITMLQNNPAEGEGSRRSQRIRKPVNLFQPAVWKALVARTNEEPRTLAEALASQEATDWKRAWDSEVKSLADNETWVLEELPEDRTAIGCRWVFKIKEDGRFKARLVAKGYSQRLGIDYQETYAPVAKFTTLRILLALVNENDWELDGMDVKTAFLHSELAETIYMEVPEGIKTNKDDSPRLVCRLIKTIYGLKQSPRAWYGKIHQFFIANGFIRSEEDHSLYIHETRALIILLYVDDMVLAASSRESIDWVKAALEKHFDMTDLGELKMFIGVEISRNRSQRTLKAGQGPYIERILIDHGMEWCATVATPSDPAVHLAKEAKDFVATPENEANRQRYQSAVGSLMYAMLGTRPDIAYAVGIVSQHCTNPNGHHWTAVKRIFRYLAGTRGLGILYGGGAKSEGFCDSDWGGSADRRSTSGYVFVLNGGAISWASRKQPTVALSSTEAEYIALTQAVKEVLWLRTLFSEIGAPKHAREISQISSDNQGAIALAKNPGFHARSKHIDIQYHFIRQHTDPDTGTITLEYCPTDDMTADILTKGLARARHEKHTARMGLI